MKLASTQSTLGLALLLTGVIASLMLAIAGALKTQQPETVLASTLVALAFYIGVIELSTTLPSTKRGLVITTAATIGCFWGLMMAVEISQGRDPSAVLKTWLFWFMPVGISAYSFYQFKRRRSE